MLWLSSVYHIGYIYINILFVNKYFILLIEIEKKVLRRRQKEKKWYAK